MRTPDPLDAVAESLDYQTRTIESLVRYARSHARPLPRHAPHLRPFTLPAAAETPPPATIEPCKAIVLVRPDLWLTPEAEAALTAWELRGCP